jgi:hypothetical protein
MKSIHLMQGGGSLLLAALLAMAGIASSHAADNPRVRPDTTEVVPAPQSNVKYLNGGIGDHDSDRIKKAAGKYNLRVQLSEGPRSAFVSGAQVNIETAKGKRVLSLPNAGPLVYVKLPPGEYRINATSGGQTLQRTIQVASNAGREVNLHWAGNPDVPPPTTGAADTSIPVAPEVRETVTPIGTITQPANLPPPTP